MAKGPEIKDADIRKAGEVSDFMMNLYKVDPVRYDEATKHGIPHGDLAYGSALVDWIKNGKPKNAIFSYADGQEECKLLLSFREEISTEFGLPILSREDAAIWRSAQRKIVDRKVFDWGTN